MPRQSLQKSRRVRGQGGVSMVLVAISAGFLIILLFIVFQFLTLNSG
ncbi:MAG: hypothetical protein IT343_15530, partial [Candidatus Melainabacteria bacterium]|nr:hypothetical protein [Candidatus Melainabacteria bacterium]